MYLVDVLCYDRKGLFLGKYNLLSPGKDTGALKGFVASQPVPEFLGIKPVRLMASVAGGRLVDIELEE